jgi:hypothetical protein
MWEGTGSQCYYVGFWHQNSLWPPSPVVPGNSGLGLGPPACPQVCVVEAGSGLQWLWAKGSLPVSILQSASYPAPFWLLDMGEVGEAKEAE